MASAPIKVIDGKSYAFGRIPPTEAVPLHVQLLKLAGPELQLFLSQDIGKVQRLFTDFATATKANDDSAKANLALEALRVFGPVAFGALQTAEGDQVLKMMQTVFSYVCVDGHDIAPQLIDATFANSNPLTMWKVFIEGLRVNLGGFFPVSPSDLSATKTT